MKGISEPDLMIKKYFDFLIFFLLKNAIENHLKIE